MLGRADSGRAARGGYGVEGAAAKALERNASFLRKATADIREAEARLHKTRGKLATAEHARAAELRPPPARAPRRSASARINPAPNPGADLRPPPASARDPRPPRENCETVVPFAGRRATFGALQPGGSRATLEQAAAGRLRRTKEAKEPQPKCERLFERITWPCHQLSDAKARIIGKWIRGVYSGAQCRLVLDYHGWADPVDAKNDMAADSTLPILAGIPTGSRDELDDLFSKRASSVIAETFARCSELCGDLFYVEQVWLACRVVLLRSFIRCMDNKNPCLIAYHAEEVATEALRQKLVSDAVQPESAWLRKTLVQKGLDGLQNDKQSAKENEEAVSSYLLRQLFLRKELRRQLTIVGKEEAYAIFGVDEPPSPTRLRKQYRQMALECHPDKGNGDLGRFHKLQSAYEKLLTEKNHATVESLVSQAESDFVVETVNSACVLAAECAVALQRCFVDQRRGARFRDWLASVCTCIKGARKTASATTDIAAFAQMLIEKHGSAAEEIEDVGESVAKAGADARSLAAKTEEAIEEARNTKPGVMTKPLIVLSQSRILALALHTVFASMDATMSAAEAGQSIRWAEKPVAEAARSPRAGAADEAPMAPPPPAAASSTSQGDGEEAREPKDAAKSDRGAARSDQGADSARYSGLVAKVTALNQDLLKMQQELYARLASEGSPDASSKEKVFDLLAAFMDEAAVDFARRMQHKPQLQMSLHQSLWWLHDASAQTLAVPAGVEPAILKAAIGLDIEAVKTMVRNELFPGLLRTTAKLCGKANVLKAEDDDILMSCQTRILAGLTL